MITSEDDPRIEFEKHVADELERLMRGKGMTQKEALVRLVESDLERMNESEKRFRELEERTISRTKNRS